MKNKYITTANGKRYRVCFYGDRCIGVWRRSDRRPGYEYPLDMEHALAKSLVQTARALLFPAPTPAVIPNKQRSDFSNYLRSKCMIVCRSSHDVAREPGARWLLVETRGGWVRAYRVSDDRVRRQHQINRILAWLRLKPFYGAFTYCVIRWKVDPQPGPNSRQRRQYDPYLRRYVDAQ